MPMDLNEPALVDSLGYLHVLAHVGYVPVPGFVQAQHAGPEALG